jgi:hypothetical protein
VILRCEAQARIGEGANDAVHEHGAGMRSRFLAEESTEQRQGYSFIGGTMAVSFVRARGSSPVKTR